MNVSKAGGAAVAAPNSPPPRAAKPRDEATFTVPKDDAPRDDEASEARDDDDAPRARPPEPSAWMLLWAPPPAPAPSARVDLTDPAAKLAPPGPPDPPADLRGATPAAPPAAPSPAAPPAPPQDDAAASPEPHASGATDAAPSGGPRPRAPSPKPGASADEPALRPPEEPPRAKAAPASEGAAPDVAPPPVTGPSSPWAAPPGEGPPRGDNALTPVSDLTPPDPRAEAADARTRLQDAATSSGHQRTLRDVAQGELTLPDLGRVAVRAYAARDAVDVEIRASQAATAHALHAQAESLAADIRAADITVTRLSFEGAGAWVPSQDTPSRGHGEDPARRPRDAAAPPEPPAPARGPGARVRIVL